MPTPTYTPVATVTLGTAASSVTFSSIPATYRDLVLTFDGERTLEGAIFFRLNGDSGSNYTRVFMHGNGSITASGGGTDTSAELVYAGLDQENLTVTQIMDYSATDKHKTVLTRNNRPGGYVGAEANRYASTSAITSLQVLTASSTIKAGSTFNLYGIAS
jgi:hypothetical protein